MTLAPFPLPQTHPNGYGWGPTTLPEKFVGVPFTPFSKNEQLGVVAAIFQTHKDKMFQRQRGQTTEVNKDEVYELVDTAPAQTKDPTAFYSGTRPERRWFRGGARGVSSNYRGSHGGSLVGIQRDTSIDPNLKAKLTKNQPQQRGADAWGAAGRSGDKGGFRGGRSGGGGGGGGGGAGGGGGGGGRFASQFAAGPWNNRRYQKEDSVKVGAAWKPMDQFEISAFYKMSTAIPTDVSVLHECGAVRRLDDTTERVSVKTPRHLKLSVDTAFVYPGTLDDPILEGFAKNEMGNVFVTDEIVAQLAGLTKCVKPFDLVFTKIGGVLFIDKRDDSLIHLLTVNETFNDNIAEKEEARLRAPYNNVNALEVEATAVHQTAYYASTVENGMKTNTKPNPFLQYTPKAQPFRYRYKAFKMGAEGKYTVVIRTEVHAVQAAKGASGQEKDIIFFTANEFDARLSGNLSWREKLEGQRGAVLSNETRNNAAKYARWTAQALLSGADFIKLAFVSRVSVSDPTKHVLLGYDTHKPRDFATQCNFNANNMWGILLSLIELFMAKSDGKYVFMRDPVKPMVRVYEVGLNEFEEDEEDEEEDEDDDELDIPSSSPIPGR